MTDELREKERVFAFLTALRDEGSINMMGAARPLQEEFGFDRKEAQSYLLHWMRNPNG